MKHSDGGGVSHGGGRAQGQQPSRFIFIAQPHTLLYSSHIYISEGSIREYQSCGSLGGSAGHPNHIYSSGSYIFIQIKLVILL